MKTLGNFLFRHTTGTLDLSQKGVIMGILNVTPDSFSDGGQFKAPQAAIQHALQLISEGAGILDIGGESTRPGAIPVSEAEELARVIPIIRTVRSFSPVLISVDTMKPAVALAAVQAGANIINDVSGFRQPEMVQVARETGAGCVVMHMQGTPDTMQEKPCYTDVLADVMGFFHDRHTELTAAGLAPEQLMFDPGIGFGKTLEHNLTLLRGLGKMTDFPRPILLGVSRKSFFGKILGNSGVSRRSWPTVAVTSLGRENGVKAFRVHEVLPNCHALRMTEAIIGALNYVN
jgi:dihydropteroate synthase